MTAPETDNRRWAASAIRVGTCERMWVEGDTQDEVDVKMYGQHYGPIFGSVRYYRLPEKEDHLMFNMHQDIHGVVKVQATSLNRLAGNAVTLTADCEGGQVQSIFYFGHTMAATGRANAFFYANGGDKRDITPYLTATGTVTACDKCGGVNLTTDDSGLIDICNDCGADRA